MSYLSRAFLVLTLLLAAVAGALYLWPGDGDEDQGVGVAPIGPKLEILGHRGAGGLFPENSIPGIQGALAIGVDRLALELVMTRDGIVVLHHDLRLDPDRTRGPNGQWIADPKPLIALLADELALYDIGRIKPGTELASRFPTQQGSDGVRIPRLSAAVAVAERLSGGAIGYSLEMKRAPSEPALTFDTATAAQALADALTQLGIGGRTTVQSFDWAFLEAFQRLMPAVPTVYLTSEQPDFDSVRRDSASPWLGGRHPSQAEGSVPQLVRQAGGKIWSPDYRDLRPVDLEEAHKIGLLVVVWTVNEPAAMTSLIEQGVDGIVTDYPDRLRDLLGQRKATLPPQYPATN
jgi:glycerophosphoryl diester phosphodiesterase